MSFEDFLEEFKKRHPEAYGLDSGRPVAVKAPMPKVDVKAQLSPVSVRLGEDWDGLEPENDEYWK